MMPMEASSREIACNRRPPGRRASPPSERSLGTERCRYRAARLLRELRVAFTAADEEERDVVARRDAAAISTIVSVRWPKPRLPRWSTMDRPARSGLVVGRPTLRAGRPRGTARPVPRSGSPIRGSADRPRSLWHRMRSSIVGSTATTWSTRRRSHRSAARSIRESSTRPRGWCRRSRRRRDRDRATTGRPSSADGGADARRPRPRHTGES